MSAKAPHVSPITAQQIEIVREFDAEYRPRLCSCCNVAGEVTVSRQLLDALAALLDHVAHAQQKAEAWDELSRQLRDRLSPLYKSAHEDPRAVTGYQIVRLLMECLIPSRSEESERT